MADGFQTLPTPKANTVKRRSFSVAELDAMFDADILSRDERIELIDGDIIQMNSQMMPHAVLKLRLAIAISKLIGLQFDVQSELTVQLNEQTLVDPDVAITPRLKIERRYLTANELLLAIEVSDTSLYYDLGEKAALYSRAGINEFWVVDINGAQTWVHRDPSKNGYKLVDKIAFDKPVKAAAISHVEVTISVLLT